MITFCCRVPATAMLLVLVTGVPPRPAGATPLGTAFTYQGQLVQSGVPTNGSCDMQFSLFGAASGGTQMGSTQAASPISLTNGLFTVPLDFGSDVFTGANRFLEIQVRCPAGSGSYVTLSPRQKLTAAPYALYAPTAGSASGLSCSGCVTADELASGAVTASAILDGAIPQNKLAFSPVLSVGANVPLASSGGQNPSISLSGTVGVANGGTGASTKANARANLNAAASGDNADITSLSGITGNITLPDSTATAGNILKGAHPFIHNFGGGTFVGENAGNLTTLTGGGNTAVGQGALTLNATGSNNVAVGQSALHSNTTGDSNTAVGVDALSSNQTYDVTKCTGKGKPKDCCTGTGTGLCGNTAVGAEALSANTTGWANTAVGLRALENNQTFDVNNCTGYGTPNPCCTGAGTGTAGCEGNNNTAVGTQALASNTTGDSNTAVGGDALGSNTTGIENAAVGLSALSLNGTGSENTAVGVRALGTNTTGWDNTAVGSVALSFNSTASYNTAVGAVALVSNNGDGNTAVGALALEENFSGEFNTAVGGNALKSTTIANSNTALGYNALAAMTSGDRNTAVGEGALELHTNGTQNTAVGHGALSLQTGGSRNTAVGEFALRGNTTGSDNIALGTGAGSNLTSGSNNIAVGHPGAAGESDTIRIGNTQTTTYVAGIFSAEVPSGMEVFANVAGKLGTLPSSARFKDGIQDMGDASSGLLKLRPVRFRYKPKIDPSGLEQYGLVAEEVAKVYPDLVTHDDQGRPQSVRYHFVNAMLLNEVQKQARRIEAQRQQIEVQRQQIAQQGHEMTALREQVRQTAEQARQIEALSARLVQLEAAVNSERPAPAQQASYQTGPAL